MSDSEDDLTIKNEVADDDNDDLEEDEDEHPEKEPADVGHYSLEEKIVAAVWVHERVRNNMTWDMMMRNFRARFKNKPPSKQTLLCWERKLFTTGNAHDKIRTGRPIARLMHVPYVQQSIAESPNLSIRERAKELGLPYATLLKILKEDLKMEYIPDENGSTKSPTISTRNTCGKWKYVGNSKKRQKIDDNILSEKSEELLKSNTTAEDRSTFPTTVTENPLPSSSYSYGVHTNQIHPNTVSSMYQNYNNSNSTPMY